MAELAQSPLWERIRKCCALMPLFWLATASGLGIVCARWIPLLFVWILLAAAASGLASFFPRLRVRGILLMAFFTFWFYTKVKIESIPPNDLRKIVGETARAITVEGIVDSYPIFKPDKKLPWEFTFEVKKISTDEGLKDARGTLLIYAESSREIRYGDVLHWTGFASRPILPDNPGQFNFRKYLANKNIFYTARIYEESMEIVRRNQGAWITHLAGKFRRYMLETSLILPWWHPSQIGSFKLANDKEISSLMSAMLWGYKNSVREDLMSDFRKTGTLHLFAVSGQNVAALTALLIMILEITGVIRWRWGWLLIPPIFIFCLATGMQPSAMRAFAMFAIVFIGWALYRQTQPLNLLGTAALLMWVWEPRQLFDVGFQLSFVIVASLLLFSSFFAKKLTHFYQPDPWIPRRLLSTPQRFIHRLYWFCCGLLGVSLAAWLGALSLTLYYFHSVTPVTPLANICIVPAANFVVVLCALAVCAGWIWPPLAVFFNQINWMILQGVIILVHLFAQIPYGHFYVNTHPSDWFKTAPHLTVLKADDSFPTILQASGQKWLLDSGRDSVWKYIVDPLRQERGINRWNGVVVTQANKSHMGGIFRMQEEMPVDFFAASTFMGQSKFFNGWFEKMKNQNRPLELLQNGNHLEPSTDVKIDVLWPPKDKISKRAQDNSLVLMMHLGNFKILWAGNIPEAIENEILKGGADKLRADALIQGSNLKEKNLSRAWLTAIRPRYLIRPSQKYGMDFSLDEDLRSLIKHFDISFIDMKKSGAVEIEARKDGLAVSAFR